MDGKYVSYEELNRFEQLLRQKDRKIKSLERQVHDWNKVFQSMPAPIRRWALWRYSKLN